MNFYLIPLLELENCDETLAKAIFVDFCADLIVFVQEQNLSTPCALYFLNLMLHMYKSAATSTLEECVVSLRSQLLDASALSNQEKPIVFRYEEIPVEPKEEVPDDEAQAESGKAKGKGKTKAKSKSKKKDESGGGKGDGGDGQAEEENKEAKEGENEPGRLSIAIPTVEKKEIPVEVAYTPQEIEAIINYVTTGFVS